ncbi:MAG: glycosyltransferase family 1 protein [Oligoflexales bacterium]|nr:glycosyltransferase family 1 protein [Oligoflexales bacterium]
MNISRSYLFVTWEGGGNVAPVLGIARRLIERGHNVRVLTESCLRSAVIACGARYEAFRKHFTRKDNSQDLLGDWQAKTPIGALRRTFDKVVFGPATIVAEETIRAVATERPDVIVIDHLMPGAISAAEAVVIPRVILFHTPEFLPGAGKPAAGSGFMPRQDIIGRSRDTLFNWLFLKMLNPYVPAFAKMHRELNLEAIKNTTDLINVYHRAERRLILTSEAFDFPIVPAPSNVRYVGPVLDDPEWSGSWESPWSNNDARPLVVASLSSTFQNQRKPLQAIIIALGKLQVRGLVTSGPAMRKEQFETPPNVIVLPVAPHSRVFPEANVVITHGGHGTVMRALSSGVPIACMPMGRDQFDNAARVVKKGVGLKLAPSAKSTHIAAAVQKLIDDVAFRDKAQQFSCIIKEDVSQNLAIKELESIGLK